MQSIIKIFEVAAISAGLAFGNPADAAEITADTCSNPTFLDEVRLHNAPDEALADALFMKFAGDGPDLAGDNAEFFVAIVQEAFAGDPDKIAQTGALLDDGVITAEDVMKMQTISSPGVSADISDRAQNITGMIFEKAGVPMSVTHDGVSVFDSIAEGVDRHLKRYATADYFMRHSTHGCDNSVGEKASNNQQGAAITVAPR